jgi:hypothetical protein
MKFRLPKHPVHRFTVIVIGTMILGISALGISVRGWMMTRRTLDETIKQRSTLQAQVASISGELSKLKNEDQYQRNEKLQGDIRQIETVYAQAVAGYEDLLRLKDNTDKTAVYDEAFADILTRLADRDYEKAMTNLRKLRADIAAEQAKIAAAFTIPANVTVSNNAPGNGYSRQSVTSEAGTNLVDIIAGELGTTRVIVDTASDGTCAKDCPVLSLGDYVSRSGAYAGVNGSYFCPADYPSCAEKKNSFDTLLMNKNKVYFNSDNNKYSIVPAVIFGGSYVRFVGQSLEWGRDTGIDSMIANQPLLLSGGNITFGGNEDPKMGSIGSRGFVANKGNTVYIGVVHNVSVAGMARVLKALGMENALNLDSGGSVALWSGGYKVGPGRNIPNAILFVRK